jgi:transposase
MLRAAAGESKLERFAPTPWTVDSKEWQALGARLPDDHLARRVQQAVTLLDLEPLFDSYLGVGKSPLRPDLLLQLVIYELHHQRPSPAQWARDARENEPLRWLLLGLEPSRARLYAFRERIAPLLPQWQAQVLQRALSENRTSATRAALDSSTVAAHASRRQFLNEARLHQRCDLLDAALQAHAAGQPLPKRPGWLAQSLEGLREQKQRYQQAVLVLHERQVANTQRPSDKRKPPEKVLVSPADPLAVLGRDKLNVFRALYNVQLLRDLDSPLILSYAVLAQQNDQGVLERMTEPLAAAVGHRPGQVLLDSGYVSVHHLQFCQQHDITVYGPCQANDYSLSNGKKKQHNQHTALPKSAFRWLPEAQTYECPQGHRLQYRQTQTQARADYTIRLQLYTCPAEHCRSCPQQPACTRTPNKGRTVSRMENEELLEALQARMETAEAKQLYKLRSQTVELNFADLKEYRGLRRFHGRGLRRAEAEVGALVLTHNLLYLQQQPTRSAGDSPAANAEKSETSPTSLYRP